MIVVLVVTAFAIMHYTMSEIRQEHASIDFNPKYMTDAHAFTRRTGRGRSYSTNFTGTILNPWSNNVTLVISVTTMKNVNLFQLKYNLCEFFKQKWAMEFVKAYSNVSPKCPVPKGTYGFYNLVLPPKNFPIPLGNGDIYMRVASLIHPTYEMMADFSVMLRNT